MPTRIHDCHHDWLVKELYHMGTEGFLTATEIDELKIQTGTSGLYHFLQVFAGLRLLLERA
ncbi:hypothetical protein ACJ73_03345 [Blastomyces percursus]|uniref:Uncharacterized protein n=1 Tax=Blastomyces percursus TaxID=1658174 RepID=A0A1J9Q9U7_9EURO|nr:hypothetical protein ACJ73_03345 [Blastomyces percursus]